MEPWVLLLGLLLPVVVQAKNKCLQFSNTETLEIGRSDNALLQLHVRNNVQVRIFTLSITALATLLVLSFYKHKYCTMYIYMHVCTYGMDYIYMQFTRWYN